MSEPQQKPERHSAVVYLAVLIVAAFLLLLLAFLMQERTNDSLEGLHQSVSALTSIDQLVEDNQALHDQVDALREERGQLQSQLSETQEALRRSEQAYETLLAEHKSIVTAYQEQIQALMGDGNNS